MKRHRVIDANPFVAVDDALSGHSKSLLLAVDPVEEGYFVLLVCTWRQQWC